MIKVAVIGEFQDGKSTLINALVGETVAQEGYGLPETAAVAEYPLPGSGVVLMDTPGFNSTRPEDSETTLKGVVRADAIIYLIASKQLTPTRLSELKACLYAEGRTRLLLPIINDHGSNNKGIMKESIAMMLNAGIRPILFGSEMPVLHANKWKKGKSANDESGRRRLRYILGMGKTVMSPLERICRLYEMINKT